MTPGCYLFGEASVASVEHCSGQPDRARDAGGCWVLLPRPLLLPWLLLLLFLLLPTILAQPARALPEISGMRFGVDEHRTRVALDLSEPLPYKVTAASDPNRLILDLGEVAWRVAASGPRPRGLARGHTFGRLAAGRSRLVVAMATPFRIVGKIILPPSKDSPHHRLVIDLVPSKAVAEARPAAEQAPSWIPVPAARPEVVTVAGTPDGLVDGVDAVDDGHAQGPRAAPPAELPVIVIDPGHGGIDPGAIAVDGALEKDLVLEMALELRRLIERTGRYQVELTRDGDTFIRLRDRITKARELSGRVFISLHADSLREADQRGASVYTLSEKASDAEAARLASSENKADILTGTDLSRHDAVVATILLDLARRDTNNRSITFADLLAEEMSGVVPMVKRHRRFAGFAVLKSPDIPSVLLELGYLSNADDARNLAQADHRAKLSKAIVRAVDRFFAVPRS
jgi:N-acetylmuramoyl-L-alanine amidase